MSFRTISSLLHAFNKVPINIGPMSPLYSHLLSHYTGVDYNNILQDKFYCEGSMIPLSQDDKTYLYINKLLPETSYHFIVSQHIKLLEGNIDIISPNDTCIGLKKGCFTAKNPHIVKNSNNKQSAIYLSLCPKPLNWVTMPLL